MVKIEDALNMYNRTHEGLNVPLINTYEFEKVYSTIIDIIDERANGYAIKSTKYGLLGLASNLLKGDGDNKKLSTMTVLDALGIDIDCYSETMCDRSILKYLNMKFIEFISEIVKACAYDLKFFLRNFVYIDNGRNNHLDLNIGTYTQVEMITDGYSTLLQNPRRTGSTTTMCGIIAWFNLFYSSDIQIELMGRSSASVHYLKIRAWSIVDEYGKLLKNCGLRLSSNYGRESLSHIDKVVFIDELEFHDNLVDLATSIHDCLTTTSSTLIIANSVINRYLSDECVKLLDSIYTNPKDNDPMTYLVNKYSNENTKLAKNKLYTINYPVLSILTDEEHEQLKSTLTSTSAYIGEVCRKRRPTIQVSNVKFDSEKTLTLQEYINNPIKFFEYVIGRELVPFEKMVIEKILEK